MLKYRQWLYGKPMPGTILHRIFAVISQKRFVDNRIRITQFNLQKEFHMKKLLFIAFGLLFAFAAQATPVLDQVVISNGGGQMKNGHLVMDLTIGEPIVGSSANGALSLDYGYWWSVLTVNVGVDDNTSIPTSFVAHTTAPNPFSTRTTISYAIPQGQAVPVFIGIYDLGGRLVKSLVQESKTSGRYTVTWDGLSDNGAPAHAGVYFAQFHAGTFTATRRVVMLK